MLLDISAAASILSLIIQKIGFPDINNLTRFSDKITIAFAEYPVEKNLLNQLLRDNIPHNITRDRDNFNLQILLKTIPESSKPKYIDDPNNPKNAIKNAAWGISVWGTALGAMTIPLVDQGISPYTNQNANGVFPTPDTSLLQQQESSLGHYQSGSSLPDISVVAATLRTIIQNIGPLDPNNYPVYLQYISQYFDNDPNVKRLLLQSLIDDIPYLIQSDPYHFNLQQIVHLIPPSSQQFYNFDPINRTGPQNAGWVTSVWGHALDIPALFPHIQQGVQSPPPPASNSSLRHQGLSSVLKIFNKNPLLQYMSNEKIIGGFLIIFLILSGILLYGFVGVMKGGGDGIDLRFPVFMVDDEKELTSHTNFPAGSSQEPSRDMAYSEKNSITEPAPNLSTDDSPDETPHIPSDMAVETPHPSPDPINLVPILIPVDYQYGCYDMPNSGGKSLIATITLKPGWKPPAYMLGGQPNPVMLEILNEGTAEIPIERTTIDQQISWGSDKGHVVVDNYEVAVASRVIPPKTILETTFLIVPPIMPDGYITYYVKIWDNGWCSDISPKYAYKVWVRNPLNADFLEDNIPSRMKPGDELKVLIKVRNDGYNQWKHGGENYRLISVNDDGKKFKDFSYTSDGYVKQDVPISGYYSWEFFIRAPNEEGTYQPQFRMEYVDLGLEKGSRNIPFGQILTKKIVVSK